MKQLSLSITILVLAAVTAACATRPAPDFRGRWKPVNHYSESTQAIPLNESYVYAPSPLDGTLKAMLTRWAKDNKLSLSYLLSADYTLHSGVANIRSSNLNQALSELNTAYAQQQIFIEVVGKQIIVRSQQSGSEAGI